MIKRNLKGQETWRYTGKVLRRSHNQIVLEAHFNRADMAFHGITLCRDDRFVETFYNDRWYNIFTLQGVDGQLKGWYANICTPISFDGGVIRYTDLDLDLWVWPDHRYRILDEEEFENRVVPAMPESVIRKAREALQTLLTDLEEGGPLFGDQGVDSNEVVAPS